MRKDSTRRTMSDAATNPAKEQGRECAPRKQTLDFLRGFARIYQGESESYPEFRGHAMN